MSNSNNLLQVLVKFALRAIDHASHSSDSSSILSALERTHPPEVRVGNRINELLPIWSRLLSAAEQSEFVSSAVQSLQSAKSIVHPAVGGSIRRAAIGSESRDYVSEYLANAMTTIVATTASWPPSADEIRKAMSEYLTHWCSTTTLFHAIAEVDGAALMDPDPFVFDKRLSITRRRPEHDRWLFPGVTNAEIQLLTKSQFRPRAHLVLIGTFELDKARPYVQSVNPIVSELQLAITSLRLATGARVGIHRVVIARDSLPRLPCDCNFHWDVFDVELFRWVFESSHIPDGSEQEVSRLFLELRSARMKQLDLAIRRYNRAFGRDNPEDSVVDHVLALESILLASNSAQGELALRLALSAAMLLADCRPPDDTYRFLRAVYNIRSKVVHGAKQLNSFSEKDFLGRTMAQFVEELERITREILLAVIRRLATGESLRDLANHVEGALMDRLSKGFTPAAPSASHTPPAPRA